MISIPEGEFAYYKMMPPASDDEMCQSIPAERTEERAACEQGGGGPTGGGEMKMRVGIIGGDLQVDMCNDGTLEHSATYHYNADTEAFSVSVGNSGGVVGHNDNMSLTIDGVGLKLDEENFLKSDGDSVTAAARMDGEFGAGNMTFTATNNGGTISNSMQGAFAGSFIDIHTGEEVSMSGKVYAEFNAAFGTAKFHMTGSMPAMPFADMIPFNIPESEYADFFKALGTELGIPIAITSDNVDEIFLCPNPDFDPENPEDNAPMIVVDSMSCPEVTHEGIESFAIITTTEDGEFGEEVHQIFTIVADSDSPFFTSVSAFDLGTLSATTGTISHLRDWDCTGDFASLNFEGADGAAMEQAASSCMELENKIHMNNGMGDYNCGEQENSERINEFAKDGPDYGLYGGYYERTSGGTCAAPGGAAGTVPPSALDVGGANPDQNEYCFFDDEGTCLPFTVTNNAVANVNLGMDGVILTGINYQQTGQSPATGAQISFRVTNNQTCVANYTIAQPTFETEEFDSGDQGGEGGPPQACIDAGMNTEDSCMAYCSQPGVDCQ